MADWKKVEQTPNETASAPAKENTKTTREAKRAAKKQEKKKTNIIMSPTEEISVG